MRRKPGALLPFEVAICEAAAVLRERGTGLFHGYLIAKQLKQAGDTRLLTAYGTLYRALNRLEQMGLLTSQWEDPKRALDENRPPRRLYELTAQADAVLAAVRKTPRSARARRRLRTV